MYEISLSGRSGRVGNLGKATSFVDIEGDGDVMPKLVDMLTKVKVFSLNFKSLEFVEMSQLCLFLNLPGRWGLRCLSSLVKEELEEMLGVTMMRIGVNTVLDQVVVPCCLSSIQYFVPFVQ